VFFIGHSVQKITNKGTNSLFAISEHLGTIMVAPNTFKDQNGRLP